MYMEEIACVSDTKKVLKVKMITFEFESFGLTLIFFHNSIVYFGI